MSNDGWAYSNTTTMSTNGSADELDHIPLSYGHGNNVNVVPDEDSIGEGALRCSFEDCNKVFHSRWSLTRHLRTHTGERPFKCSVPGCNKEFVQKCSLTRHEQTHLNDKMWCCDHYGCGKKFKLKEYLDVHKRTHMRTEEQGKARGSDDDNAGTAAPAKETTASLVDQLRQRLVRMSVRHHEQLFVHQQREEKLLESVRECAAALEEAISLLNINGVVDLPESIISVSQKYKQLSSQPLGVKLSHSNLDASSASSSGEKAGKEPTNDIVQVEARNDATALTMDSSVGTPAGGNP